MPRLMLRDTVTLRIGGGGYDNNGDPIPVETVPIPAEVVPVSGEEQALRGRMTAAIEARFIVTDARAEAATEVTYRGNRYTCQGKWQVYRVGGRIHHLEVIGRYGTG